MSENLNKTEELLEHHTLQQIKQFNQRDSEISRPSTATAREVKESEVYTEIPKELQHIAQDLRESGDFEVYEEKEELPKTLVTARLHKTADLPEVYKNGTVEGNNACWRDVELRGHIPGPLTRLSTATRSETSRKPKEIITNKQEENLEDIVNELEPKSSEEQYKDIGRLMRNNIQELTSEDPADTIPEQYYPDKQSVKNLVKKIQQFDDKNPYLIDAEMRKIITSLQRDIYSYRELKLEKCDDEDLLQEISDRIQACRQILLMDMNDGFLLLEDFDSEDFYEIHTPQEWIDNHCKQFIFPDGREIIGIPGYSRYLYKDRVALEPVVVTAYNEEDNVWHIYWIAQNTQMFALKECKCTRQGCELIHRLNELGENSREFKVFSDAPAFVSPAEKAVKRLNLLFADEDERMWWERRWQAHYMRRMIEQHTKEEIFLNSEFDKACRIKEYIADNTKTLDFRVTRFLEILADVAGPTSEIIDNIFHKYVLDNDAFYKYFISKIDEQSYERLIQLSQRLVSDVTEQLIKANMLAVIEYLRHDRVFNHRLQVAGLNPPRFLEKKPFTRQIATVTEEFNINVVESLINFAKRRARISIISLEFSNEYKSAYDYVNFSIQDLIIKKGLYFFNFAGIIPFLAMDEIELIISGFAGGLTADEESYALNLVSTEQKEEKPKEEIIQKGGLRIRVEQRENEKPNAQEEDDKIEEITSIPFYAHPQTKNLDKLGTVSPGLPLSLEEFEYLSDGHRERLIIYFEDFFLKELANEIGKDLKESNVDISLLESDMKNIFENTKRLDDTGCDKYSVERDTDQLNNSVVSSEILNYCTDKPRQRTLFDLQYFCKFINLRYYDCIMHISDNTTAKYLQMLNAFRVTNCMPYDSCVEKTKHFIEMANNSQLSTQESEELMQLSVEELFKTVTVTTVNNSLLKIFVNVKPFIREMRQVSAHDANYIPPSNEEFFNEIANFVDISDELMQKEQQEDDSEKLTFDHYYFELKEENIACETPTLMNIECTLLPSVERIHDKIIEIYELLLHVSSEIRTIDTTLPCLQPFVNSTAVLPNPDPVHDPWLPARKQQLVEYLNETEKGPIALFDILKIIIRELFYVDSKDYVQYEEGVYDYEVKLLPPIDEFNDIDELENDINNAEDNYLITCKNWDYVVEKEAPVKEESKEVKIQPSDDDSEAIEEEQESDTEEEQYNIKINNTNLSLRDLRGFLQKYTAIREFLKEIAPQTTESIKNKQESVCKINFGLYSLDITNVIDILIKRCNFLRAEVIRIIQQRLVKRSQSIVADWQQIQQIMTAECKTTSLYAKTKQYLSDIHNTIKSMQGKQIILDRYMQVCEEFSTSDKDFLKILFQYYTWFQQRAAATSTGGYNKLNEHYRDRLSKALLANLPDKIDDRFWNECVSQYWLAKQEPKRIISERDSAEVELLQAFQLLSKKKDDERGLLAEQINNFIKETVEFAQTASLQNNKQGEILSKLEDFQTNLKKKIDEFLLEEKQLALPPTDFGAFDEAVEDFELFDELWSVVTQYQSFEPIWLSQGDFMNIDPNDVGKKTADWTSSLQRLNKQFAKLGRGAAVFTKAKDKDRQACCADAATTCQDVMKSIEEFIIYLPLIESLRNPGLKPYHWAEISEFTKNGKQISPEIQFTLQNLLDEGLMEDERLENVIRISDMATREAHVDKQLLDMLDACKALEIEMKLYATDEIEQVVEPGDPAKQPKQQRYFIIRQFDDALQLLDEQFSIIQGLRASQFGKSKLFKTRIDDHDDHLNVVQDIIDEWTRFQRLWLYLYPIFTSEDIKRQLPTEAILFAEVCAAWSDMSCETENSGKIWAFSGKKEMIAKFQLNYQKLEDVNKELSSYLESKRLSFSRFFFLSDEELLQILAQTKNVENVQLHIQKCFEGMKQLTFGTNEEGARVITQMVSPENERVDFRQPIVPQGDADVWLNEIEKQMKATLRELIRQAWRDYAGTVQGAEEVQSADPYETLMGPRERWLARWPAQIVNVLSQVEWTFETQDAVASNNCLLELSEINNRIDRLVLWVGCTPQILEKHQNIEFSIEIRTLLTTLLTLWVHNRDVVSQLNSPQVDKTFLFSSELRYYYEQEKDEMRIEQVDATLYYEYEYLGNHSRLAITPLTDRCFLTLTSALAKCFGGAPAGCAGSGKSESTKDLAKSLGIGCYIFNCSEGLNESSLRQFFCGLCICGMFSCFDEFNRCSLDILSVTAGQIITIQRALRAHKKVFNFDGEEIALQSSCGIFITMNPGYAGRNELPTNLKNLFRPIAMNVPDYEIIAEILLFASGYREASTLSIKICETLKLASESLSKESHYDFGMRALKSILSAAARLKRLYWQEQEDLLCLRAVNDVNLPKFLAADVVLYNNIVSDLFMECYEKFRTEQQNTKVDIFSCSLDEITIDVDAEELLQRFINDTAVSLNLMPTQQLIDKTMQLYATMTVRHGLMNVGNTMTGKSTVVSVLAKALGSLRNFLKGKPDWCQTKFTFDAYPLFYPSKVYKLNPNSITLQELYGQFSDISQEWKDGIFCTILRQCNEQFEQEEEYKRNIIIFDGVILSSFIENLNSLLDDSRRLSLVSGEIIQMPSNTTCMFETRDLDLASPATVSRCGMIFYDETVVEPEHMFDQLCQEQLPAWFLNLELKIASSWPIVKLALEVPAIHSPDQLTVKSGTQPEGRVSMECYGKERMTVRERLQALFVWMFDAIYAYLGANCQSIVFQTKHTVVMNLVSVMKAYIESFSVPESDITVTEQDAQELKKTLPPLSDPAAFVDCVFLFGLTWSLGAYGDQSARQLFNQILRHIAFDVPQLLIAGGVNAGIDYTMPGGKPFSNSSVKTTKSARESSEARGKQLAEVYRKLIRDGMTVWRIPIQVPYTEDLRQKGEHIVAIHDVCLNNIEAQTHERARGLSTPFTLAEKLALEWIPWKSSKYCLPEPEFKNIAFFNDVIVPTQDTISMSAIASMLCEQGIPILFAGSSGSGKTTLAKLLMKQDYISIKCCLTAKTTSSELRALVDSKLEKLRKGVYCISKEKKSIFFIDDAHMPEVVEQGVQPPLEVIRELLEDNGWYDIDQGIFKKIINMSTIVGVTTNGEIQEILPQRLFHHVTLLSIPESSDDTFAKIYNKLLSPFVKYLPTSMNGIIENIVHATISLYRKVRVEFKPTPSHMHYIFGPRDLSKVFEGLLVTMKNANIDDQSFKQYFSQQQNVIGLWVNECMRIFADRLINDEDNKAFMTIIETAWNEAGSVNSELDRSLPEGVVNPLSEQYEINYGIALNEEDLPNNSQEELSARSQQEPEEETVEYPQIPYEFININDEKERALIMKYYNNSVSTFNRNKKLFDATGKMDLILFKYALTHLLRITRILQLDRGHGLLIGMPSSGKRSLTRLAAASLYNFYVNADDIQNQQGIYLSRSSPMSVLEPNGKGEFLDKIKAAVKITGIEAHPCLLIISESLADNYGLECINFLINLGEIPNLFNADDRTENEKNLMDQMKDLSSQEMYEIVAERVIENLHIIITITPGSKALDNMVTFFPSLLGSMSVDWFTPWEEDTLLSISKYYLKTEESCDLISNCLVSMYNDTETIVNKKYSNLCTSPAAFLSMITNFLYIKQMVSRKQQEQLNRYSNGVQCLKDTEKAVVELRQEQTEKQPILQKAEEEVSMLAKQIDEKRREMAGVKEVLAKEEYEAGEAKAEADELADICEQDLDRAQPLVDRATKALSLLKASDVNEVRSFTSPTRGVILLGEVICIVRDVKISSAPDANNWPIAEKVLRSNGFLNTLKSMKELPDNVAEKLGKTYINDPAFTPKVIAQASAAAAGICEWVHALYEYYVVMVDVKPKQAKLEQAQAQAKQMADALEEKQRNLKEAEKQLELLESEAAKASEELQQLSSEYETCCSRLKRAEGLISGLSGEEVRWNQEVIKIEEQIKTIIPTAILATGYCACLGGIEFADRNYLVNKWTELIIENFQTSENEQLSKEISEFQLPFFIADQPTISTWISNGLSKDEFSQISASIAIMAEKVPILIDPQQTAKRWASVTLVTKDSTVAIVKYTDQNLGKQIETALRCGQSLIISGIGNDNWLRNDNKMKAAIIAHNLIQSSPKAISVNVKFGESEIVVPNTFRLCLITSFDIVIPADIYNDFTVITFKATREALTDLLVSVAVECENPEIENSRRALQTSIAESQSELLELETNLLNILSSGSSSEQSLLDNVNLMNALNNTQERSQEISRKMVKSAKQTEEIEQARQIYEFIAGEAATLYFCILGLTKLDQMYDNSLQNFIKIYMKVFKESADLSNSEQEAEQRLRKVFASFAGRIYKSVSRGLFVEHKLAFSFDITLMLEEFEGELTQEEIELILAAFSGNTKQFDNGETHANQYEKFEISNVQWNNFSTICQSCLFTDLNVNSFEEYECLFEESNKELILSAISYVLFCSCLKESDLVSAITVYIKENLGSQFVETEAPELVDIVEESISTVPTLILLSADSDPSSNIVTIADQKHIVCHSISIGKGQGPIAEQAIQEAAKNGEWVLIGNTHLGGAWLNKLESIIESISDNSYDPSNTGKPLTIHEQFRLFLTTMPFDGFPSQIIRAATKVSAEAPIGVKNNFIRLTEQIPEDELQILPLQSKEENLEALEVAEVVNTNYRKLLWNLALFFAVTLERRRFGPIGFSTKYDWSDPDFLISQMELHTLFTNLLSANQETIYTEIENTTTALKFLISSINTGGRVSDAKDQLIVDSLMDAYYSSDFLKLGQKVNEIYGAEDIEREEGKTLLETIISSVSEKFADTDSPELFGLDNNASILLLQQNGQTVMNSILTIHASNSNESITQEEKAQETEYYWRQLQGIRDQLPPAFNQAEIEEKYPTSYLESMNTVLTQECARYSKLIKLIEFTCEESEKSLKGLIMKSAETEGIITALRINKIPLLWEKAAWPSVKPLSTWLDDLKERMSFIEKWVETGECRVVWFSGFSYPQAFLTGVLQNYSRKQKIPIDKLIMDFEVVDEVPSELEDGSYIINGLFLQGGSLMNNALVDSQPGQLFTKVPYILLRPCMKEQFSLNNRYKCPVYRTTERKGVLTTTGHSSNYIMDIYIECDDPNKWVRKGAALFEQSE